MAALPVPSMKTVVTAIVAALIVQFLVNNVAFFRNLVAPRG
jgi:hypothetical protein